MTTMTAWNLVAQSLARPYRVTFPMVFLVALVPFYIFIPQLLPPHTKYFPALALDRALPLLPSWALIYGALYLFLILLPILAVRDEEHIRRTFYAYLFVWITAYIVFIFYPTEAPRPARVVGEGFAVWGLQALYSSDPPYNCFPSLHVAHSFVSALTVVPLHRRLGIGAITAATFVALSTLFTKQHYVLDAAAGVLLALVAWLMFLRAYSRDRVPALDRQAAPAIALCVAGVSAVFVIGYWVIYLIGGQTRFDFGP